MLSADKHSQISQISQLQMGENFSGATEISDAVWKIEVSEWNSSVFSAKFVTEYTTVGQCNALQVIIILIMVICWVKITNGGIKLIPARNLVCTQRIRGVSS